MFLEFSVPPFKCVVAIALAGCVAGANAADQATLRAAAAEGLVVFYSSVPSTVLETLAAAFSKEHPGIRLEYYRSTSTGVLNRLNAEIDAGRVNADVVHLADTTEMDALKRRERLARYDSAEYAAYPSRYIDPDKTWFTARAHFTVIGYNTRLVPPTQVPTSWLDLTAPSSKGRISVTDPRSIGGGTYWRHAMWALFGPAYMQNIAANQPLLTLGIANINDRIISGEVAMAPNFSYLIDEAMLVKGAPIAAAYPKEGAPLIPGLVGAVAKGPHPNAAKVLVDYIASRRGQEVFNGNYTYSVRPDVPRMKGMRPFSSIKALTYTSEELARHQKTVEEVSRRPFGLK